jgi:hypothetical protein
MENFNAIGVIRTLSPHNCKKIMEPSANGLKQGINLVLKTKKEEMKERERNAR